MASDRVTRVRRANCRVEATPKWRSRRLHGRTGVEGTRCSGPSYPGAVPVENRNRFCVDICVAPPSGYRARRSTRGDPSPAPTPVRPEDGRRGQSVRRRDFPHPLTDLRIKRHLDVNKFPLTSPVRSAAGTTNHVFFINLPRLCGGTNPCRQVKARPSRNRRERFPQRDAHRHSPQ